MFNFSKDSHCCHHHKKNFIKFMLTAIYQFSDNLLKLCSFVYSLNLLTINSFNGLFTCHADRLTFPSQFIHNHAGRPTWSEMCIINDIFLLHGLKGTLQHGGPRCLSILMFVTKKGLWCRKAWLLCNCGCRGEGVWLLTQRQRVQVLTMALKNWADLP